MSFDTAGLDPAFLNDFFTSDGSTNWTGYANPDLDNALNEAVRATDEALRRSYYAQVQRTIMDEALVLPIRDYVNMNASSAGLSNLEFDSYGWFPVLHNLKWVE